VQAAVSKDKPLLDRAQAQRDYAKVVDIALGWPLYFAKKFNATVRAVHGRHKREGYTGWR
jgi:hypothetical protein